MTALPLGLVTYQYPIHRMNEYGFLDDDTVPMKTGDVPLRVDERCIVDLVRVYTDLALSAF